VRIRRRYGVILALVGAGALAISGIALGAASSTFSFKVSPNKVPKKKFKPVKLFTDLETSYTNPGNGNPGGAVERTQIYLDKNFKINPKAAKKCSASQLSSQTMAGAMANCKKALVGKGQAQAVNPTTKTPVYACVLLFNGKPQKKKPTLQVFTRVDITGAKMDCSDPAHNTKGQLTVLLTGVLKNAKGKYGKVLDVDHITKAAGLPLTVYKTTIKHGKFMTARCKAKNKTWHMQTTWTYNDGKKTTIHKTQKCKVKRTRHRR
jgi:hypothetical protein